MATGWSLVSFVQGEYFGFELIQEAKINGRGIHFENLDDHVLLFRAQICAHPTIKSLKFSQQLLAVLFLGLLSMLNFSPSGLDGQFSCTGDMTTSCPGV